MSDSNDDIFSGIPFGKWNLLYLLIICLQQSSSPAQYYGSIFVDMPIGFRCSTNVTRQNITFDNSCFVTTQNSTNVTRQNITYVTRQNITYVTRQNITYVTRQNITFDNSYNVTAKNIVNEEYDELLHKCTTYDFDTSQISSTFTSEFQLVCDKAWVSSMYQLIFPIGSFIGTFFLGASDKWGRVTIVQISSTIHCVGALFVGLARYYYLVLLGRLLVGLSYPLLLGSAITLCMETSSPKHRSTVGFMMLFPFYISEMLLGILAYYIRDWRMLYLIASIPMFPIPIISLFLDKSPRWLIQKGRLDKAYIIMHKAAKMNKGTVDFDLTSVEKELCIESDEHEKTSNYICDAIMSFKMLIKQLYGTAAMLKLSFVIPILWFLSAVVYFGVPLNANSFTNNPYLYIIMIGAAECPAAFLGPFIIKCFGNIKTGIGLFLLTCWCMLATLLAAPGNILLMRWIFSMLSMTCCGAIITICSLLVAELFPTVLRSTGYGMSHSAFYVGFFLSSFADNSILVSESWWAFNSICGTCCIIAAILVSLLPETHGQKLCETTHEVNKKKFKESKSKNMIVDI